MMIHLGTCTVDSDLVFNLDFSCLQFQFFHAKQILISHLQAKRGSKKNLVGFELSTSLKTVGRLTDFPISTIKFV